MGILYHLHSTDVNVCSGKFIPTSRYVRSTDDHLDELMNYFITTTGKEDLLVASSIYLHIEKGVTPDTTGYVSTFNIGIFHYKITLYSYKFTLKQLKEIINQWTNNYRDYIKEKNKGL